MFVYCEMRTLSVRGKPLPQERVHAGVAVREWLCASDSLQVASRVLFAMCNSQEESVIMGVLCHSGCPAPLRSTVMGW
ncbi:hypothetical protein CBR_g30604 [Chara braunii]|uniref:Uncharacterized protein n=1 Tax=Chara braunii TaxID=69332 RepID=A0A388LD57_CHABU|nr:hypothetical protein CBR_g30604 [Chara braunii]|eukprot:GBG80239.1 hypothetical protein CBR_g30604 [Chara braunii]